MVVVSGCADITIDQQDQSYGLVGVGGRVVEKREGWEFWKFGLSETLDHGHPQGSRYRSGSSTCTPTVCLSAHYVHKLNVSQEVLRTS